MDDKIIENDLHLIEACIKKDIAAWASLVKKYSSLVYISIENRLRKYNLSLSRHDVEDIKQNIFTDIWENNKLEGVTSRDDISYWISILAGNAAIEHFRKKDTLQEGRTVSLFGKIGEKELHEVLPSGAADPKDELARAEISGRIDKAMEDLPEKEKLVIKLFLIHDKGYHEIAEILDLPRGTVSSYIKRAKEKLRRSLKDSYE
jgi:RNA polymerase sigma-70 factor, ECF subfamily